MTAARPDTWMPFYIGDYLRDTGRLTTEGHGAYVLLIFDYWTSGKPLPDDDAQLSAITKLPVARWKKLRPVLAQFFSVADGVWRHKRVEHEIGVATEITGSKSKAGKAGAEARWQKHGSANGTGMADASSCQWQTDAQSQSHKQVSKEEIKDSVDQILKALGGKRPHSTPQANWDDPANRKARWQQKMQAELFNRLPKANAEAIWTGYVAGDPKAIAFIETVDKSVKQRRASVQ